MSHTDRPSSAGAGADVLDVERLDDAAGRAMAGRTVDLADVQRRASSHRRRSRSTVAGWAVLAAAAALVVGVLTPAGGRMLSSGTVPASQPKGPGTIPSMVYAVPAWVPSLTDAPMARAALVVAADIGVGVRWNAPANVATGAVLVSADGSQYAALPDRTASAVSLSRDGTKVAWAAAAFASGPHQPPVAVRYMETAGGQLHEADISDGRPTELVSTLWSPDGRYIAVESRQQTYPGSTSSKDVVNMIDTSTGQSRRVCFCSGPIGWAQDPPVHQGGILTGTLSNGGASTPRLLLQLDSTGGVNLDWGPDVGTMPTDAGASGDVLLTEPQLLVSDDGGSYLLPGKADESSYGELDDFSIVRGGTAGSTRVSLTPALGQLYSVYALAWDGADSVWFSAASRTCAACMYRFSLASGEISATVQEETNDDHPVREIAVVAQDVALGGQVMTAARPSWPWYQQERIQAILGGARYLILFLFVAAGLGAVLYLRARQNQRDRNATLAERERWAQELGSPE